MTPRALAVALALLLALAGGAGRAAAATLRVGVLVTDSGQWAQFGRESRVAAAMWADSVAARGGLGGNPALQLELAFADAGDAVGQTQEAARALLNGSLHAGGAAPDVLVAPYSSRLTPAAAALAEEAGTVIVSGGAASVDVFVCGADEEGCGAGEGAGRKRRYQNLFGLMSPADTYLRPFVALARIQQARTVALLAEDDSFPLSACAGAREAARDNRMEVVADELVPRTPVQPSEDERAAMRAAVDRIRARRPDAVAACTYAPGCHLMLELLEEAGYLPDALAATICVGSAASEAEAGPRLAYVYGPGQWDRRLTGAAYSEDDRSLVAMFPAGGDNASSSLPPAEQFARAFEAAYAESHGEARAPSYQAASFLAALYAVEAAAADSGSTASDDLRQSLQFLFESSFYGLLASSRFGHNAQKSMVTWQYSTGAAGLEVVTPLSAAQQDPVYPMPGWDERVYERCMFCLPEERGVIVAVSVLSAASCVLAAWLWVYRERPYVKQASASFCVASVAGSIVTCLSVLTWPVENSEATCAARPWMVGLGLVGLLAPVIAKTYRVMTVFNNKALALQRISNRDVARWTGLLVLPMALLLAAWAAASPLRPELHVDDPLRPASTGHTACSSEHGLAFAAAAAGYVLVLLAVAAVLAFRTRNAWDAFNDARYTSMAVYNLVFCGVMLVVFEFSDTDSRATAFLTRSVIVLVMVTSFQAVLFVPKILNAVAAINAETAARPFDATQSQQYNFAPSVRRPGDAAGSGSGASGSAGRRGVVPVGSRSALGGTGGGGTGGGTTGGAQVSETSVSASAADVQVDVELHRPRFASMSSAANRRALAPSADARDPPLPDGWTRHDSGGVPYFWNESAGTAHWSAPRAPTDTPRRASEAERALVKRVFRQLTDGCGNGNCDSAYCRSSPSCAEAEADCKDLSVRALQLFDLHGAGALCRYS